MPMFGLKLMPGSEYVRMFQKAFTISGVAIEKGVIGKFYLKNEDGKFIFATVSQAIPQAVLDMKFGHREMVIFGVEGDATIALTGYWEAYAAINYTVKNMLKLIEKEQNASNALSSGEEDAGDEGEEEDESSHLGPLFQRRMIQVEFDNDGYDENDSSDDTDDIPKFKLVKSKHNVKKGGTQIPKTTCLVANPLSNPSFWKLHGRNRNN